MSAEPMPRFASTNRPRAASAWGRLAAGLTAFLAMLVLASAVRACFFLTYRSSNISWSDAAPAFAIGIGFDAKWLAISLVPAFVLWVLSFKWAKLFKSAVFFGIAGAVAFFTLALVNFGFYAFYNTPISAQVFGLVQDDTWAIIVTVLKDWPVFSYLFVLAVLTAAPFLVALPFAKRSGDDRSTKCFWVIVPVLIALYAVTLRGGIGKFPLRREDMAVSPSKFVTECVPNGAYALYDAFQERKRLLISTDVMTGLKSLGFRSLEEASALLPERHAGPLAGMAKGRHVMINIMESMGRDQLDAYRPGVNDSLGRLADAMKDAVFFDQGIAITGGTFSSTEGILFDTPFSPISQSRYGAKRFDFSKVLPFKAAGYRIIFLTSCTESWRNVNERFPIQGFDEVIGAATLLSHYPQAEQGPWGIGDEWMFKYAEVLLKDADKKGEKLFIVALSSTNHPPHKVPDGHVMNPVDPKQLPADIDQSTGEDFALKIQTYQYAADQLGGFIQSLKDSGLREKIVVAATGDHNTRFKYTGDDNLHRRVGVPILFWLPESLRADAGFAATTWASHRDIFPTMKSLVLGQAPAPQEGRDLFSPEDRRNVPASTFTGIGQYGFSISRAGIAGFSEGGRLSCYEWTTPAGMTAIKPAACSDELVREGNLARAQRAVDDYLIRESLKKAGF